MAQAIFNQPQFQDPEEARAYLEAKVWPDGPVCPHCGSCKKPYALQGKSNRPGLYKCADCREPFTVTVKTIFERSKIPLHKWLLAVYLLCSSKKGMSSHQLHRTLGVTYKTAWFMTHRIREAMNHPGGLLGARGQAVEVDETFWGNRKGVEKMAGGVTHKMKVVSLVERGGEKRSVVVQNVTAKTLGAVIRANVSQNARLMTDERRSYIPSAQHVASHEAVSHRQGEYFRAPDITTNSVESSFALLKRGLIGTFHHVGEQHLERYAHEFDFRWTYRVKNGYGDKARADQLLRQVSGKRLTYRRLDERTEEKTLN
jgi:transposase-like protein